ncbi:ABC transporter ATP-binding protein [Burkholderia sp. BCC1988]|uniref:ABC transporter ATP-binding protein n=1 Tax=Burkholderia sp. BCC1988 TaxID=2817443 RepID=UPI002AB0C700|nr:ABC transporter ATP-binding protein [Burkholderia sp. BCC1988]
MSSPSTSPLAIDVRGLHKRFGERHVVNNVSLQVRRGEIFGFLGPNGSGKTTCIRMLCGLLTPDAGSGTCLGFNIASESPEIKRHVGYMTQRFSFWEDLSIRENLDFVARIYGIQDRPRAITRALEDLGLTQRASQLAGTLSGGWKQRLALAACLLHEPQLLLLDEPTAGVDPSARRDFWEELHRLAARGISVLVSTHYMDEAERCHKLAYIAWGELLAQGTASEITDSLGLSTWAICGDDLVGIADRLRNAPGVMQTVAFGSALHVSGTDAETLLSTIDAALGGTGARAKPIQTSLEHAFIFLMKSGANAPGAEGH